MLKTMIKLSKERIAEDSAKLSGSFEAFEPWNKLPNWLIYLIMEMKWAEENCKDQQRKIALIEAGGERDDKGLKLLKNEVKGFQRIWL